MKVTTSHRYWAVGSAFNAVDHAMHLFDNNIPEDSLCLYYLRDCHKQLAELHTRLHIKLNLPKEKEKEVK